MKNDLQKNYIIASFILLVAIGASFFVGVNIGEKNIPITHPNTLINAEPTASTTASVDFAPFWKAWSVLNEKWVGTGSSTALVGDQDKVWGAISGLTQSLGDPYTMFFPPKDNASFAEDIAGNFSGVGMEVGVKDGVLTVIAPLKNTPAYNAGILAGDKILKIDATSTEKLNDEQAIALIRGKDGTKVVFTIFRTGKKEPLKITVTRGVINIPTIDNELLPSGVYVIKLYNFSAISPNLFRDALRAFIQSGAHKLILDLRGNPGGYLEAATDMASWFLPPGKVIVRESFGPSKEEMVHRSKGYDVFNKNLQMVVLIDQGSASASEILAGALHEQGVATLVGDRSFGKGSVQELVPITADTSLKVTIARWLTPNGLSISGQGLTPDVLVKRTADDYDKGKDPQMDKAVEILLNK